MRRIGFRLAALLAATATAALPTDAQVRRERGSEFVVKLGDTAPRFGFATSAGDTLDTDFLHGQVVVLQFAASWCPFSAAQMWDHQSAVWAPHRSDAGFSMYIVCEDRPQDLDAFARLVAEEGIEIPYIVDADERIYRLFVTPNGSVTRTVVIAPDRTVAYLSDRHSRRGARQLRRTVRRLLSAQSRQAHIPQR